MSNDIVNRLTTIFHAVFENDSIVLSEDLTANDVDNWDSLNHVNLMITIEGEFGIRFTNTEISSLANVGELIRMINSKLA